MPRIRCLYFNCLYLDDDICTAPSVEINPDIGCSTFAQTEEDMIEDDDDSYDSWDTEDLDSDMDEDDEGWD
jgi:hypothetical protein